MSFVPEGQHDRSQARSAWSHEENTPVPAGRLNGSRLRLDTNIPNVSKAASTPLSTTNISGTDQNGAKIRKIWDVFCPGGATGFSPGFQPGVSTLGTAHPGDAP